MGVACVVALVATAFGAAGAATSGATRTTSVKRPTIGFVLTDDLDFTAYTAHPKWFPHVHRLLTGAHKWVRP